MPRARLLLLFMVLLGPSLLAQDDSIGISMPITLTGEALFTHRVQTFDPDATNRAAAFRAVFYPSVKLGKHWYFYSAIQVSRTPFFYYDIYYPTRVVETDLIQSFMAYSRTSEKKALTIKAGKLASAFGSFPLRYDDAANPLVDSPPAYGTYTTLRADQLPCGVPDLVNQVGYKFIRFSCGGSQELEYGIVPDTDYGIPGAEVDVSVHRLDARFQLTNSSPAYAQSLVSDSQNVQWVAGAGFTIRQGFRVGFSAYRGPFLSHDVLPFLPPGKGIRDYSASAEGIDVQWARGRWSTIGEWQWYQFDYPGFQTSPAISTGYAEVKAVLTPRLYGALRISQEGYNRVQAAQIQSAGPFQPSLQTYEFGLGIHLDHLQTVKIAYEVQRTAEISGNRANVLGIQLVTSIDYLSKVLRSPRSGSSPSPTSASPAPGQSY